MRAANNIPPQTRFGYWLTTGRSEQRGRHRYQECVCDCGTTAMVCQGNLSRGKSISCGCYRAKVLSTHRLTDSPEYAAWCHIKRRCGDPNEPSYHNYGGRGIKMCKEWEYSFERFYEDMGPRPSSEYSIERKDNDRGYEPENCCWATRKQQLRNTRTNRHITYDGATHCIAEWSEILGISHDTLYSRLFKLGWAVERAFTTPVLQR